ncbi:hypothetical protein D5S18_23090 [Nocardia panacis]|uniref:Cyclic nucleotide-binding domain-containing protein n=1 Tax=Nocardia panacis TaxID=2340916 RepID=A0A3A4KAH9_9NOCA|nr:hypothetical protein [Nocardia panacis]RJO72068.1 hypothetical protein D5S18_23090 [Nocardia panacis]
MRESRIAMDLNAIERRIAAERYASSDRSAESELRLAASLIDLAKALLATHADKGSRDRSKEAVAPAEEGVMIRLRRLADGQVEARFAAEVTEALRIFEQVARHAGRREQLLSVIRWACDTYRQVAQEYPQAAGMCADGLSKCGVWLARLDQDVSVAATLDAARIRSRLAAENPELAGKYLSSLSTLLRTLMVGRSRRLAISMYRERFAAMTSTNMSIRLRACGIRDLDLTPKAHRALTELNCRTLEQAGQLTQQQILYKTSGDLSTVEEINWRLTLVGLRPLEAGTEPDPPALPVELGTTYGALAVRVPGRNAAEMVRAALIAAYSADDVYPVDRSTFLGLDENRWRIPEPELNAADTLSDDVVLIDPPAGGWVVVMSMNWELAPLGRHPLALRLSQDWPVLSITQTADIAYELCWYEKGVATEFAGLGRPSGQPPLDAPMRPLDFARLADYGVGHATEAKLRAAFGNSQMFTKLSGLPDTGLRQVGANGLDRGHHVLFLGKTAD